MTEVRGTILIVDDEARNRRLLEALLRPEGYTTRTAASGAAAVESVAEAAPDLILLDVMLPGMSGHEVAMRLKADPTTRSIPIIMVTAQTDRAARLAALDAGAEEFLTKPVDRAELWLRVRNLLRLKSLGDLLASHQSRLEAEVVARTSDLQYLAHYDALTGLPNRTLFYERLASTLQQSATGGWTVAILFIDLDHFKNVNDTLGHGVGDELLVQASRRLSGCTRARDTVGRLGGDEFALIVVMSDPQGAAVVATKIQEALREPFIVQGHELTVTASIGITAHPDDANDPETLIKYADTAMYEAKQSGRDAFRFFTPEMNAEALKRLELETALRRAVKDAQFVLHYQPKVLVDSGTVCGLEALLRWDRPGAGLVPPNEFIPALEECGLIVDVGRWVISEVCAQVARWRDSPIGPLQVSVNVSSRQFVDGDLDQDVFEALQAAAIAPHLLELELTESSLMANTDRTIATLESLKARGVQISIDDFGTGYSSLAYLRRFPIDKLKIDAGFIRDITTDPNDAAIAVAIIRMAHSLGLDVIAEGVETAGQLQYLRRHRCDQMQGFLFSRPLPVPTLEQLLHSSRREPMSVHSRPHSTLLLVDADPATLDELVVQLEGEGFAVLTARSAAEAFDLVALEEPQVILCDQGLPDMSGTDFLHRVKELHPRAVRLMLSGCTDEATLAGAINRAEVYRYYAKPCPADELRRGVRDAFRRYWHSNDVGGVPSGVVGETLRLVETPA